MTKEQKSPEERIKRLEELVSDLYYICEKLWGGEGSWQKCWDRLHKEIEEIKHEHKN